jgi:hypothetical protein
MFKVEWIVSECAVERLIINHANSNATRQLSCKQFLIGCIEVAIGYGKRLAHNTTNGILCQLFSSVLA